MQRKIQIIHQAVVPDFVPFADCLLLRVASKFENLPAKLELKRDNLTPNATKSPEKKLCLWIIL